MRPPELKRTRSQVMRGASRFLLKLTGSGFPRSRHLVHLLVLVLALLASLAGGRVRSVGQFDVISNAFSLDTAAGHRSSFARSARGSGESLVKAPSVETRLMNRPRRDVTLHFVRGGETLQMLAQKYGVDVETIAWANYLEADEPLRSGQLLIIPPVKGVLHVVRPGDTVEKIAARYQVAPEVVTDFNQLSDPSQLLVGERLVIPGGRLESARAQVASRGEERKLPAGSLQPASLPVGEPTPQAIEVAAAPETQPAAEASPQAASEPAPTPGPLRPWIYVVQEGDTVLDLAIRFGISPETIVWANGLGSAAFINIGQELIILPVSGVLHTVAEGDSLEYIANLYQADVQSIVEANQLADASAIGVGEELIIPGGQLPMPVEEEEEPTPEPEPEYVHEPKPEAEPGEEGVVAEPLPGGEGNWDAVSIASEFLGYPYVWGGSSPRGFDCSGLVYYVYTKRLGIPLPRTAEAQYGAGVHVGYDQLAPGDIVFFRNTYRPGISHVGIYMGGGRFIHAASVEEGVTVSGLGESYWAARYAGATRVH